MKTTPEKTKELYLTYKKLLSPIELSFALCKWEFLRRNKNYRKFFNKHKNVYSTLNKKDINIFLSKNIKTIKQLEKKFGIKYLLNPDYKITPAIVKKDKIIGETLYDFLTTIPVIVTTHTYTDSSPISAQKLASLNNIELKINLAHSQKVILSEIGRVIKSWQDLKKKYNRIYIKRFRPKDIKIYLKVWNFKKADPNITYKTIAKMVLRRGKTQEITRGDEDCVAKQYKACCRLIEGDYKKITL